MTNLPTSNQPTSLDNFNVDRSEYRQGMENLLAYLAQALGGVSGTYTTQPVDPLALKFISPVTIYGQFGDVANVRGRPIEFANDTGLVYARIAHRQWGSGGPGGFGGELYLSTKLDASSTMQDRVVIAYDNLVSFLSNNGDGAGIPGARLRFCNKDSLGYAEIRHAQRGSGGPGGFGGVLQFLTRQDAGQGGNWYQRAEIDDYGAFRLSANSSGIQFNGNAAAANSLNAYEEGTFTPALSGSTTAGTATYTAQHGNYVKVGKYVHVDIVLGWSAFTGAGDLRIAGLPFTPTDINAMWPSAHVGKMTSWPLTSGEQPSGLVFPGSPSIVIYKNSAGSSLAMPCFTAGGMYVSADYISAT
jgi:hypothetical protein